MSYGLICSTIYEQTNLHQCSIIHIDLWLLLRKSLGSWSSQPEPIILSNDFHIRCVFKQRSIATCSNQLRLSTDLKQYLKKNHFNCQKNSFPYVVDVSLSKPYTPVQLSHFVANKNLSVCGGKISLYNK